MKMKFLKTWNPMLFKLKMCLELLSDHCTTTAFPQYLKTHLLNSKLAGTTDLKKTLVVIVNF